MKSKKTTKNKEQQETYKDLVCGMEVSRLTAPATAEYHGKTYYFCADLCRDKFDSAPEKYIDKWPRKEQ